MSASVVALGQSLIPPILGSPHRQALLGSPDVNRTHCAIALEDSCNRTLGDSGALRQLTSLVVAPSGGMRDCPITELPPPTCAHCTGAKSENHFPEEVDYQTGRRFDTLLPEARQFSALNDGPRRKAISDLTVQSEHHRTTTTGLYNKTDLTYGGNDDHIEYERLTPETS